MAPKSKTRRNALRRARYNQKRVNEAQANRRKQNQSDFEKHWESLELNRARSKRFRDEQKQILAQNAQV